MIFALRGCLSDISSSHFLDASKVWGMLHHGSVGASLEQNKRNLTLTRTLTLDLLLPPIVFHNKNCDFVMLFTELSFLQLIHCLFFIWGGNVSLAICRSSIEWFLNDGKVGLSWIEWLTIVNNFHAALILFKWQWLSFYI